MNCLEMCENLVQQNKKLELLEQERHQWELEKQRLQREKQQLEQQNSQLERENAQMNQQLSWYQERYRLQKQRQFGHSSESTKDQLSLFEFNEVERTVDESLAKVKKVKVSKAAVAKKTIGKRQKFWDKLPQEVVVHELPQEERSCPVCKAEMHEMSEEERMELKIIPPQFIAVKHIYKTYACRRCEQEDMGSPVVPTPAPQPPIPKSIASPSAVAFVLTQKYDLGMPLHRLERFFEQLGLELTKQTMSSWVLLATDRWLKPLYDELHRQLLQRSVLHSDETPIQVLREPGRAATTKSSMWLYRSSGCDADRAIVLYEYLTSKAAKGPAAFLGGFHGYLHVDGASVYGAANLPGVVLCGCWSHSRRGFVNALKAAPEGSATWGTLSARGLEFCDMIFELEAEYDRLHLTPEQRLNERQIYTKEVLQTFHAWLKDAERQALKQSALGKAIKYCLNQWAKLTNILQDGRVEASNNRAERSIKPFVMGRKAWLFANTPSGATASAIAYSIIETAKENGVEPFAYLTWLFERLPNMYHNSSNLQDVLPWSPNVPQHCRIGLEGAS